MEIINTDDIYFGLLNYSSCVLFIVFIRTSVNRRMNRSVVLTYHIVGFCSEAVSNFIYFYQAFLSFYLCYVISRQRWQCGFHGIRNVLRWVIFAIFLCDPFFIHGDREIRWKVFADFYRALRCTKGESTSRNNYNRVLFSLACKLICDFVFSRGKKDVKFTTNVKLFSLQVEVQFSCFWKNRWLIICYLSSFYS